MGHGMRVLVGLTSSSSNSKIAVDEVEDAELHTPRVSLARASTMEVKSSS